MALSIENLSSIDPDKIGKSSEQIFLTSDDLSNSSCVFNAFVCQTVKLLKTSQTADNQPLKLFLILFNQAYNEVVRYQIKNFGLSIKLFKDANQLIVIDFLSDFKQILNGDGLSVSIDLIAKNTLDPIREALKSYRTIVLIDDISCLLTLGLPFNQVYQYYRSLRNLAYRNNFPLIMQSYFDYKEDDTDINRLCQSFIETSSIWLQCKHLETGFSSKVDGNLIINDYRSWPTKVDHFHFKRMARNFKLLTVGAFT